jgi:hypothetical protein
MTRSKRPLFGGAIQAFLPDGAIDARYIDTSSLFFEDKN